MNKKGYTLIEVITTVTILMILMVPLTLVLNTWYEDFYADNSTVFTEQRARDLMTDILGNLRKNYNLSTQVTNENKTLVINDEIKYEYNDETKKLFKNGEDLLINTKIEVIEFKVEDNPQSINISIKLKSEYDINIELINTFRKRI